MKAEDFLYFLQLLIIRHKIINLCLNLLLYRLVQHLHHHMLRLHLIKQLLARHVNDLEHDGAAVGAGAVLVQPVDILDPAHLELDELEPLHHLAVALESVVGLPRFVTLVLNVVDNLKDLVVQELGPLLDDLAQRERLPDLEVLILWDQFTREIHESKAVVEALLVYLEDLGLRDPVDVVLELEVLLADAAASVQVHHDVLEDFVLEVDRVIFESDYPFLQLLEHVKILLL